jgi:hypothetical protein
MIEGRGGGRGEWLEEGVLGGEYLEESVVRGGYGKRRICLEGTYVGKRVWFEECIVVGGSG